MSYREGFNDAMDSVFREHLELDDHRADFPWLVGALGDPTAPVWLVAENPSLKQVRKRSGADTDPNQQWQASDGDRLLRQALGKAGLVEGDPMRPSKWNCYITNVIKSAVEVTNWLGTSTAHQQHVARLWAPVLRYEIQEGAPRVLGILGGNALSRLKDLRRDGLVPEVPGTVPLEHYSSIAFRPDYKRKLPRMHPERISRWEDEIKALAG